MTSIQFCFNDKKSKIILFEKISENQFIIMNDNLEIV